MAVVERGGRLGPGQSITVVLPDAPHVDLVPV
jgi:hypothetical protein